MPQTDAGNGERREGERKAGNSPKSRPGAGTRERAGHASFSLI